MSQAPEIRSPSPYPLATDSPEVFNAKANEYVRTNGLTVQDLQALVVWLNQNVGASPILSSDATTFLISLTYVGFYIRFTNAAPKDLNFIIQEYQIGQTFNVRNIGAGDLTIDNSFYSFSVPAGGSLVIPQGGTVSLIYVGDQSFDIIGQTVAA